MPNQLNFQRLKNNFEGDLFTDDVSKVLYATDASAYREIPTAVAIPKTVKDIQLLVDFAQQNNSSLIPRTAGTSLAGQVVGKGIVVDMSKYMTGILHFDKKEKQISVQPGVIRDVLNQYVKPHGLFFGPETSTSNRCMMGGMTGNNACGTHALIYGSTRDKLVSVKTVLSDGSTAEFKALNKTEFIQKTKQESLEGKLYQNIYNILSEKDNQNEIRKEFPRPEIKRRNTGYAIDLLLESEVFSKSNKPFNFAKLIAGSEGTLAFITEITLQLDDLAPPEKALIPIHLTSLESAYHGNLIALRHKPVAVELMDDIILKQSRKNKTANENAFFIKGTPKAILMVEFAEQSQQAILQKAKALKKAMKDAGYGYHFPVLWANDINKAWDLRKAGLGLMSNTPGDKKPASVIEDTAVRPEDLPAYMHDFDRLLKNHGLSCVKYAHISTGELHLRPVLNLKTEEGNKMFRTIARETAKLVKKYRGSLSGEHGDGRLRGEFIPLMIGDKNFELIKSVKKAWDPENIFNPGKITDTPAMNKSLRYKPGQENKTIPTIFDFSADQGFLRAAEKCTGSGDCRKPASMGGTMCPSYQATKDEYSSTRARANILREYITQGKSDNVFGHEEIKDVLDLCLSCKACKSECPAGVDITKLKAEAMQHYYDIHGVPLRSRLIANIYKLNRLGIIFPQLTNFLFKNKFISGLLKKATGFAVERSLPLVYNYSFKAWAKQNLHKIQPQNPIGELNIFNDEFTNYNDVETGMATVKLLCKLNYKVCLPKHTVSGRTFLSKGLLRKAKKIAVQNIEFLQHEVNSNRPLVGIEPSAILTFRDEYTDFFKPGSSTAKQADELSANCYTIEEFLSKEIDKGKITSESFTEKEKIIKFHGHCYQKALSSTKHTKKILELPKNFSVSEIDSGCCGMAGAFGYEKEHYRLSQKVGELSLFPAIKNSSAETIISAAGTSCRHQIKDGTTQEAKHPVQILYESLK